MFKKGKIYFFISILIIFSFIPTVFAAENSYELADTISKNEELITDYVCNQVIESYSEYYTIPSISADIVESNFESGEANITVDVEFKKILLVKSASDLPYVKGLESKLDIMTDHNAYAVAKNQIESIKKDLNDNYIGKEQSENAIFNVVIPISNIEPNIQGFTNRETTNMQIYFKGETGEIDMLDFKPISEDELFNNGVEEMDLALKNIEMKSYIMSASGKTNPSSAKDYNRIRARNYARDYSCGKCTESPHRCRNKNYPFYNGSDCANFVSQAINAGGISTERNWKSGTNTWINTGYSSSIYGLKDYMIDQGFFFESSNKNRAMAGSFIYWTSYSHVGLVDQNDTVTMTYCAHTNDRRSSSFKDIRNVSFYIPTWDSYGGVWTR